jgi:thioredoxin-dependent peroxiredoxin
MWHKFLPFTRLAVLAAIFFPLLIQTGNAQSLQVGDYVPEFEVLDEQGTAWKLREHLGKRVLIVFFYPSDFSFCCTRQAERYRDSQPDLAMLDAEVVGISCDSMESHQLFKTAHALNYPLLADQDGNIARQFGVPLRAGGKAMAHDAAGKSVANLQGEAQQFSRDWTAARWTFVIGKDGRVLHRDTRVSPVSDSKTIAEVVCNLTAN